MFTNVCGLLFGEIARGIFGGLGGERLLDLILQAVHEFRLLVAEGCPGELLEHGGGIRELAFGDEAFGFVDQPLGVGGVCSFRGFGSFCSFSFGSFGGFGGFSLGGFSGLVSRIGGGTGGLIRVVSSRRDGCSPTGYRTRSDTV